MSRTSRTIFAGVFFAGFALMGTFSAQAKQDRTKTADTSRFAAPLTAADKQHFLQDNFVIAKTVSALPKAVQSELLGNDIRSNMADAGQPFERTDMVGSKLLPFERLIYAGTSTGYCFVYNEHGGIGYWTQVSLYRLSAGQAILIWRGTPHGNRNIFSLPQLRDAINNGKFDSVQLPEQQKPF